MDALVAYSWPGNVRELANVIERAVINSNDSVLRMQEDLSVRGPSNLERSTRTLDEVERNHIILVLEELHWRIDGPKGAARVLGINPSTLRTRMAKLGIYKQNGKTFGASD